MRWAARALLAPLSFALSSLCGAGVAEALEAGAGLLWWQYEEIASDTRYTGAPFHSRAEQVALRLCVQEGAVGDDGWGWSSTLSSIVPLLRATEHWPRADFLQTNDLRIGQLDGRLTLRRTLQQGEVGLFAAARWQQQARERFRKNGAPLPDPLITETIRSLWAGLLFASRRLEIRAALPLWVRTRNSSIPNTFRNRRGYRAGASLHLPLAQWLAMPLHLRAAYRIQQFAGEAQTTALWPKNRFQTLSLAVEGRW